MGGTPEHGRSRQSRGNRWPFQGKPRTQSWAKVYFYLSKVFIEAIFPRLSWAKRQFSLPAGSCLGLILRLDEPRQRETQHAAQGHLLNPHVQESSVMHFLFYTGWGYGAARREGGERRPGVSSAERDLLREWVIRALPFHIHLPLFQILMVTFWNPSMFLKRKKGANSGRHPLCGHEPGALVWTGVSVCLHARASACVLVCASQ